MNVDAMMNGRVEFGDWQTPKPLAEAVVARVVGQGAPTPSLVLEPTCGEGSFLAAAAHAYREARLLGYDINAAHAEKARAALPSSRGEVRVADFFQVDWEHELRPIRGHLLVIGNLPWVTNSVQGARGSRNVPKKSNLHGLSGLDAMTGKSNFDVSEWMVLRLLHALRGRRSTLAFLSKTSVARRVVEFASRQGWDVAPGGLWRIDAMRYWKASVDAVLFVCETGCASPRNGRWPVYESLDKAAPSGHMEIVDGALVADAERVARSAHLVGHSHPVWRSGLKHDCARVMELRRHDKSWVNGFGEPVSIEEAQVFPLLKSSDVANVGRAKADRAVIVTQRKIGDETAQLRHDAPRLWAYLSSHRQTLAARKSAIYRGQPEFAMFGVGAYSFAPWKVAVSGLYKSCAFTLVAPVSGRPVMLDDTCYFLSFDDGHCARRAHEALTSRLAADFFASRVFLDAKRPMNKGVLGKLDLDALMTELHL